MYPVTEPQLAVQQLPAHNQGMKTPFQPFGASNAQASNQLMLTMFGATFNGAIPTGTINPYALDPLNGSNCTLIDAGSHYEHTWHNNDHNTWLPINSITYNWIAGTSGKQYAVQSTTAFFIPGSSQNGTWNPYFLYDITAVS